MFRLTLLLFFVCNKQGLLYTASGYSVNVIRIAYGDGDITTVSQLPEMPGTQVYLPPAIQTILEVLLRPFYLLRKLFGLI